MEPKDHNHLTRLQCRLLGIHDEVFQSDQPYLLFWITPVVAEFLHEYGVVMQPDCVRYRVVVPLDCHRNAFIHANHSE